MDDKDLKNLRISIRRTRSKLRKCISTSDANGAFQIPGVVNIIIDCICWNRHMINSVPRSGMYFGTSRRIDGLALYVSVPDSSDFCSSTRYMDGNCGLWALLKKMDNVSWDWGYEILRRRLIVDKFDQTEDQR